MSEFEKKYIDVLFYIETGLLSSVKEDPLLCDHDILRVTECAISHYKSVQRGQEIASNKLTGVHREIFGRLLFMCEWRLGRLSSPPQEIPCDPITIEELLQCFKRVEKSIKFWTKQGGRKGYVNFAAPRIMLSSKIFAFPESR